MLDDLRSAWRSLRRAPGFFLAAACCLGLALGANATVFSLVDAVLLRPLPHAHPEQLLDVKLWKTTTGGSNALSVPYAADVNARAHTLTGLAGFDERQVPLRTSATTDMVNAADVTANYFAVLGAPPLIGRGFRSDDGAPGAPRVAELSEPIWRARFGADPGVVGRTFEIDGRPTLVVGVMPARAAHTGSAQVWLPLTVRPGAAERGSYSVWAIARRAPNATMADVNRELARIGATLAAEYPETDRHWVPRARSLRDVLTNDVSAVLWAMLGAVGFVLLIAAANVANLMLGRTAHRARELAVRATLGAGRGRVLRLIAAEGVCVAAAGALFGTVVAAVGIGVLARATAGDAPVWLALRLDARVLGYMTVLALTAGVAAAMIPALRATGASLAPALRVGDRGATGGRRVRDSLVVAELALSLALLAGAGLLARSVQRAERIDVGFNATGLVRAQLRLPGDRYETGGARLAFVRSAEARLAALPGAAGATATDILPLTGGWSSGGFVAEGQHPEPGHEPWAHRRGIDDGYFALLGSRMVAGREFTPAEARDSAATVVVVNETLARREWPGASPLGRRLATIDGPERRWLTVVGVVRDARIRLAMDPENQIYRPLAARAGRDVSLVVRAVAAAADSATAERRAAALVPAVRSALGALDPSVAVAVVEPMSTAVREGTSVQRLIGALFGTFAAVALLLAVIGVYAVIAYQVGQRVREMGVRIALGARPRDVLALVARDGARLAAGGVALGLLLTFAVTRVLASALYGVSATDPGVLAGAAAALATAALAASWIPARRASRVDPARTLRAE